MIEYIKVAPINYDATVTDTDDLSTIRGSSLTLLAMPPMLDAHLATAFADRDYRPILTSASELLFRISGKGGHVAPLPRKDWPKVKGKGRKVLDTRAEALGIDADAPEFRAAADELVPDFPAWSADRLARALALLHAERHRDVSLQESEASAVLETARCFLGSAQTSDTGEEWPFDAFQFGFASVIGRPHIPLSVAIDALDTQIACGQLRTLSFPPPSASRLGSAQNAVCAFTGIRDCDGRTEKGKPVSTSVSRRRRVGLHQKTRFYQDVLSKGAACLDTRPRGSVENPHALDTVRRKIDAALEALNSGMISGFANDFGDIVADPPKGTALSVQTGLTIIAIDGNGFGSHRDAACAHGIDGLARFGRGIEGLSAGMLADILLMIAENDDLRDREGRARFETLLWGADEFTFVCPAWSGWAVATRIQETIAAWRHPVNDTPLTFGAGLLFAPHHAPIRESRRVAEDELKTAAKTQKNSSMIQTLAFEGIDHAHFSADDFRSSWLGQEVQASAFSLDTDALRRAPKLARKIRDVMGRGALKRLLMRHSRILGAPVGEQEVQDAQKALVLEAERISIGGAAVLNEIFDNPLFNHAPARPLLSLAFLDLMFDYLPEVSDNARR